MALEYPYSEQAERAVLGAMLFDPNVVTRHAQNLNVEDFYIDKHQKIFDAISRLFDKQVPVDLTTVTNLLVEDNVLDSIGGIPYLSELIDSAIVANTDYYVTILKDKSSLRNFVSLIKKTTRDFNKDSDEELTDYYGDFEKALFEITRTRNVGDFVSAKSVATQIQQKFQNGVQFKTDLKTGYSALDDLLNGGWHKGDLVVLAARPGNGKTALALNFAYNAAKTSNRPVCFFNLEMSKEQLVSRLISMAGYISGTKLATLDLDSKDFVKFDAALNKLRAVEIAVDDTANLSVNDIATRCRKYKGAHPDLGMVVVDHLNLIKTNGKKNSNRAEDVGEITRELKILARELEVPILLLAQLNRKVEERQGRDSNNKRPNLADLRDSGNIEQDADIVSFIYDPSKYKEGAEKEADNVVIEYIVEKHRNGRNGTIKLSYTKSMNSFTSTIE